ncbi:DUF1572 family protein [Chitinophaga pinensis]|uniref:DUF1572 domain-containing protein n=1 Tax=Chitinophaga pinensis TaxID=79329 RepID=A0A5C6LPI5_9BACT|nr:DUF1572 family protein [Chitinophaga pinensis]TWV97966.1 DUF1572 domain-containing protein [Chitinophaga pinensis]
MIGKIFLDSVLKRFAYYKSLGDQTIGALTAAQLHWQPEGEPNSIYLIIKHMSGNMRSRWTDFLTSDGEKPWRNRDVEFEADEIPEATIRQLWEDGWKCMLDAIAALQPEDLEKTVYIRSEPHIALDAINRQLAHLPYHVGQIVYIGKMIKKNDWQSLSIPKGKSQDFNQEMFGKKQ